MNCTILLGIVEKNIRDSNEHLKITFKYTEKVKTQSRKA